jgi:hypothetical protein
MRDGIGKLLARSKAKESEKTEVSDDAREQGKSALRRRAKGIGTGGPIIDGKRPEQSMPVHVPEPQSIPIDLPPPQVDDSVSPLVEEEKTAVFEDDDPLALVLGEEGAGLLGEIEKIASGSSIYGSEEPHPIALFQALSRDFDRLEWTRWEAEAIGRAIEEVAGGAPSPTVRSMIGALAGLVESEAFWNEHHIFLWTAAALNGQEPDFSSLPDLTPAEVVFAIGVANLVRDNEPMKLPNGETLSGMSFDPQVAATIATVFHMDGLVYAPEPVEIANEYLDRLHDSAIRSLVAEVKAGWDKISEQPGEPDLADDAVGLQLARLWDIREYVRNPHA